MKMGLRDGFSFIVMQLYDQFPLRSFGILVPKHHLGAEPGGGS